jgi:RluA family pseudouridine synthase
VRETGSRRLPRGCGIRFEDDDILVVEKPAGLLTIATATERRNTMYAYLRAYLEERSSPGRVFIVHRLDREASGLLVFAKTADAKHALQAQFKSREAGRTYVALVEGVLRDDARTLRSHLAENAAHRVYAATPSRGKLAVTHVRVVRRLPGRTLIEASLETGRKHQIRVQLAEAGHPIAGDRKYGSRAAGASRLALHAARLAFRHPRTGRSMEFTSTPPAGLGKAVSARRGGARRGGARRGRTRDARSRGKARGRALP